MLMGQTRLGRAVWEIRTKRIISRGQDQLTSSEAAITVSGMCELRMAIVGERRDAGEVIYKGTTPIRGS